MFWLKADAIADLNNGEAVNIWSDSSAKGNDFTGSLWAAGHNPTYNTTASLNGFPVVSFDAVAKQWLGLQAGTFAPDGPLTMIVVTKDILTSNVGTLCSFNRSDNGYHQSTMAVTNTLLYTYSRSSSTGAGSNTTSSVNLNLAPGSPMIAVSVFDNGVNPDFGVHTPYVNGTGSALPAACRSPLYNRIGIGAMTRQTAPDSFHSFLDGDIAEVLVYNRVLTKSEINALCFYLSQKYSIETSYTNDIMLDNEPNPIYPSLKAWLKADSLELSNGSVVEQWLDSSDNRTDFIAGYSGPADNTCKPTFITNELNGYPILRFTGSQYLLNLQGPLVPIGPVTIIAVAKDIINGQNEMSTMSYAGVIAEFTADDYGYARASLRAGYNQVVTHSRMGKYTHNLASVTYDEYPFILAAGTFEHSSIADPLYGRHTPYINGVAASQSGVCNNTQYNVIAIGSHATQHLRYPEGTFDGTGEWLYGDIAEILIYEKVLDASELFEIGKYLTQKYNIATNYITQKVIIEQTDGKTQVCEEGSTSDTFQVVLTESPLSNNNVNVDVIPHFRASEIRINSQTPGIGTTLIFNNTNWNIPQTVTVTAVDDAVKENELFNFESLVIINFKTTSTDPSFDNCGALPLRLSVVDNELDDWTMYQSDLNQDTYTDLNDLAELSYQWLSKYYGDDFGILASEWNQCTNPLDASCIKPLTHISNTGSGRATAYHSMNKIVRLGNKTHIAWQDTTDDFYTRIKTYYHDTDTWSPTYTLGNGYDNHGVPALLADNNGYLHIFYYPHHKEFRYRRSLFPNDASQWTDETFIGDDTIDRLTYPTAVCTKDNKIILVCRHRDVNELWTLAMYEKEFDQPWQGPRILARGNAPQGYTSWSQSIAVGLDGESIHISYNHYETEFPDPAYSNVCYAVAYIYSPDQGATWKKANGTPITLPATSYTADIVAGSSWPTSTTSLNNCCVIISPENKPWILYANDERCPYNPRIVRLDANNQWQTQSLLPVIQNKWPDASALRGNMTFDADGNLYIALTALTSPTHASWGHDSSEVILLVSKDMGQTFRIYRISPWDSKVPNWHPSIEMPTNSNKIGIPSLLFTHGERGTENSQLMTNDVVWCNVEKLISGN